MKKLDFSNGRLLMDGSMGSLLMAQGFHPPLEGLCLSRPELVRAVHRAYLDAGANIISTNTFQSGDPDINIAAARLARTEVDAARASHPAGTFLVAGSMGPCHSAAEYAVQARALRDGGADFLLLESCIDLHGTMAALEAIKDSGLPYVVSVALREDDHMYSGQDLSQVVAAVSQYNPAAIGLNCGCGPHRSLEHLRHLRSLTSLPLAFYPNAGLPDAQGHYHCSPAEFASIIKTALGEDLANILGGCCGTTPAYIAALRALG